MSTRTGLRLAICALALGLSACDAGTYTRSTHSGDDAPTGSLLSGGNDTGMNDRGLQNNPSVNTNAQGPRN